MSFFKKIFLMVTMFSLATIASAQTPVATTSLKYELPQIYVRNLTLDKSTYQAGETIHGSFDFGNDSASPASDIHYEIRLTDKYQENGLAGDFYDYKSFGPYYFSGSESKKISFDYILPKNITGSGLGIQVASVLGTGQTLGWNDQRITVSGVNSFMKIDTAEIISGEKIFSTQAGPTLKKDKEAYLQFEIENPNKSAVAYMPNIKIYERATNKLLSNVSLAASSLPAGQVGIIKYPLPRFADKSGVYVGKVAIIDDKGFLVAPAFDFRYIVAGPLVTINNLVLDSLSAEIGQTINGTLSYTGAASDIENPEGQQTKQNYNLDIKIFSLEDALVGEYSEIIDFNQGSIKNFSIKSLVKTDGFHSEVFVRNGDEIITQYFSSFPLNKKVIDQTEPVVFSFGSTIYFAAALLLIGLVIIILMSIKFFKQKKGVIISITILFMLFGGLFISKIVMAGAYGGLSYVAPWNAPTPTLSVSVNASPSYSLNAGQAYSIYGSVSSSACGNEPGTTYVYVDGALVGSGSSSQTCKKTCSRSIGFSYSSGTKYAPNSGGNFCKSVSAVTYQGSKVAAQWNGGACFTVANPLPAVGVCGTANNLPSSTTPNTNLCSNGALTTPPGVTGTGPWSWTCNGTYGGGVSPVCSAPVLVPLSVSCSVNPNPASINQVVSWTSNPTNGIGSYIYSWTGTGLAGQTTKTATYSYSIAGTYFGTTTVRSGTETVTVGCPSAVGSSGPIVPGGPVIPGGGRSGSGVSITSNGSCGSANGTLRRFVPITDLCSYTSIIPIVSGSSTGPWTWTCTGSGTNATNASCLAEFDSLDSNLVCSLSVDSHPQVNINTNTVWTASSSAPLSLPRIWIVNGVTSSVTGNVLNNIFNTTGLKTVSVKVGSSTTGIFGPPCTATTTAVVSGAIREQ